MLYEHQLLHEYQLDRQQQRVASARAIAATESGNKDGPDTHRRPAVHTALS